MGHIQRGDERQYLSKHVPNTDYTGEYAALINQGLQTGVSITQKANESNIANYGIELSNNFLAKNNEINTKYQSDPDDPERERELREAFDLMASKYKINPLCQKQWNDVKTDVYNNYQTYNSKWAEGQKQTNAQISLKNGCEGLINQAYTLGRSGIGLEEARLIYANGYKMLKNGAVSQLGEITANEAMNSVTHDFMANYLNGFVELNPAQGLMLLKDESIQADLANSDTIQKLEQTARQKMLKQTEIEGVNRVADYITKNNDVFSKALDGTITTSEAQNFLTDKNVDRQMRAILSSMLGYNAQADLWVDLENGEIHSKKLDSKKEEAENDPNYQVFSTLTIGNKKWTFTDKKGKLRTPSTQEKLEITSELYLEGSRLLNGVQGKTPTEQIRKIAEYQSKLAQGVYFGVDKTDYDKMMNTFVLPATNDIQAAAQKYNANISSWNPVGGKYGWQQIDKYFDKMQGDLGDKPSKSDKDLIDKEKSLASVYYWASLNNYASQRGISINDIFGLSREERGEIYDKAAKEAIQKAKSTTQTPSLWFRSANPQYVSQIRNLLPNENANNVITNIAAAAMSNPDMGDKDFDAVVNREVTKEYARMRTQNKTAVFNGVTKYDEYINNYSMQYGIDPLLVKAVIKQESGFDPNARSSTGAGGLMQLMPSTAKSLGVKNVYDPRQNISGGVRYLSSLVDKFDGNIPLALAAYNAGEGNVKKYGNKIPPFKETQEYVKKIMAIYNSVKG